MGHINDSPEGGLVIAPDQTSPQEVVRVLAALADVNRFRIVELLAMESDQSCGAIGRSLGLSPSLMSHHLGVLEHAGVIDRRRNGLWTMNSLHRGELNRRLDRLQRLLAAPVPVAEELLAG
jgi:ArsR family transcriptional regulator, arsenate/arsenite/antimonite-responsive transcriptional repressor